MTEKEIDDLLLFCARNNTHQFNMNKALEEAVEFQEVIIKLQTKNIDNPKRPPLIEVIKEFGDLQYRGLIAILTLYPELSIDDVDTAIAGHISYKLERLTEFKNEGKYKGGL